MLKTDPCAAVFEYTETKHGSTRILISTCLTCGKYTGSHVLKSQEELRYWCDVVIAVDTAKFQLKEYEDCHRAGISYDTLMGFKDDGSEMSFEEYQEVLQLLKEIPR